jgi:type IV pilus assembly protein PilQ
VSTSVRLVLLALCLAGLGVLFAPVAADLGIVAASNRVVSWCRNVVSPSDASRTSRLPGQVAAERSDAAGAIQALPAGNSVPARPTSAGVERRRAQHPADPLAAPWPGAAANLPDFDRGDAGDIDAPSPRIETAGWAQTENSPQSDTTKTGPDSLQSTRVPIPAASSTRPGHIELNVRGEDVRAVLMLLSQLTQRNIIASETVKGPITLQMHDVTLDAALDAICKVKGYVARHHDNFTYVTGRTEATALELAGATLDFRVYRPTYVSAKVIQDLLTPYLSPAGKIAVTLPSTVGIESNDAQAGGDSFANGDVVIVQDAEPVLKQLDELVAGIDVQPAQVLIEAVLLSVQLNDANQMGVNFAFLNQASSALAVFGSGAAINHGGFQPTDLVARQGASAGQLTKGFADSRHGLKFGFVDDDFAGFLHLLEQIGQTSVLANPKLLVLNKQRAELIIGKRLGYRTLVSTETSTVENVQFLEVGTQLRIRPFVQSDGTIRMELHPERSTGSVGATTGLPEEETTELTSNVMIPDGSTLVIGGLIEDQKERIVEQIPFLGSLPWVGRAFRNETETMTRRELVILITPRIVQLAGAAQQGACELADLTTRHETMGRSLAPHMRQSMAQRHYDAAVTAYAQGDMEKTQRQLRLALFYDPTHAEANRLQAYLDADFDGAVPSSDESGRLVPVPEGPGAAPPGPAPAPNRTGRVDAASRTQRPGSQRPGTTGRPNEIARRAPAGAP